MVKMASKCLQKQNSQPVAMVSAAGAVIALAAGAVIALAAGAPTPAAGWSSGCGLEFRLRARVPAAGASCLLLELSELRRGRFLG